MSLLLKNSPQHPSGLSAKVFPCAGSKGATVWLEGLEISSKDMAFLVEYWLTNTDLQKNDPRLKLLWSLSTHKITKGLNKGGNRVELEYSFTEKEDVK